MMTTWLYLLPEQAGAWQVCWWRSDDAAQDAIDAGLAYGSLEQAAQAIGVAEVMLLLPLELACYRQVALIGNGKRWLRQSLISALEAIVADDIERMHVALGQPRTTAQGDMVCGAVAIERAWLQRYLTACSAAGIAYRHAYIDADYWSSRVQQPSALYLQQRWLIGGVAYRMALQAADIALLDTRLPPDLCWRSAGQRPPYLRDDQAWQAVPSAHLALSGRADDARNVNNNAVDLLQAEFGLTTRRSMPWRSVAAGIVLLWLSMMGFDASRLWSLQQHTQALTQDSLAIYAQRYPHDRLTAENLENLFEARQQRQLVQRFAARLDLLGKLWVDSNADGAQVKRLEYKAEEGWILQVEVAGFAELEQLRAALSASGAEVQTDAASRGDQGVSARLLIRELM